MVPQPENHLRNEKKDYVLEQPYPDDLPEGANAATRRAYEKHCNDSLEVSCLMLATMSADLQKHYENAGAHTMIQGLREMFGNQARAERYNISSSLFVCKLTEGSPVSPHVIKMIGYIASLERLGSPLNAYLAIDVILQSLPLSYKQFIMDFHMNSMGKTLSELHSMLKTTEESIKQNTNHVMIVQKENKKRKRWTPPKGKAKGKVPNEPSSSKQKPKVKSGPTPDDECFHCHAKGHRSRNCKKYLEDKKKKGGSTSASGIYLTEINIAISSSDSWVFDTSSMIYTCKSLQEI